MNSKLLRRVSSELIYGRRRSSRLSSSSSDLSERIKAILSEDEKKEYDGKLLGNNFDATQQLWDPEFLFTEVRRITRLSMNGKLDEALLECDLNMFKSMIYPFQKGSIISVLCVSSLDKELIQNGIDAFRCAAEMAYPLKPKRKWKNLLFKPDYNSYTDEQIMAEVVYCASLASIGGLTLINDKSYRGLLSAAVHFNKSFRMYSEAMNIMKYRKKWDNEVCQKQYTSAVKLIMGITNLIFHFAPSKLAKLLQFVGFPCDLNRALQEIYEVADYSDGIMFLPAAQCLLLYYGLLEPMYGVGEVRKEFICEISETVIKCDTYGGLNYFFLGARELLLGNFEMSIQYELKTKESMAYFGNMSIVTSIFNMLNYLMTCNYKKALECIVMFESLKVKSYLPTLLVYIHASVLRMMMDEEDNPVLEEQISEKLQEVKRQRGFFVLKKVFYEKIITFRSQQYCNNVRGWQLPLFEILYIANLFHIIDGQPKYLDPFLEKVETKFRELPKNDEDYWDKYGYLLFFKGFLLKLRGDTEEALASFHEILSLDSFITHEAQVLPQTCFEIGLIHRKNKNVPEAKRWLTKASKYSDYVTEFLIKWRSSYALDHMEPLESSVPESRVHLLKFDDLEAQ